MSNDDVFESICRYLNDEIIKRSEVVGIGTGRTVKRLLSCLDVEVLRNKTVIPSSIETALILKDLGIKASSPLSVSELEVYIDSADYATRDLNLIKGGGGALTMEKLLASSSKRVIIVINEEKLVEDLLAKPIPVEVLPQAPSLVMNKIYSLGMKAILREPSRGKRPPVISDIGGVIIDVYAGDWRGKLKDLEITLKSLPGVVETGLFINLAHQLIVETQKEMLIYQRLSSQDPLKIT